MSKIARAPKTPPAQAPSDPRFFDERDLEAELKRTFQICHECRMCVGFCGSFPDLFRRIDRDIESGRAEGAELLGAADFKSVVDECWQCKLCYVKCPYTKDDGAYELLDFPRLMGRAKAVEARRDGVPIVDRVLGEPQLVGALGAGFAAGPTNLINKNRLLRKVQEKVAGISSEFPLPPMASETFSSWFASHSKVSRAGEAGTVVLFSTCYGEFNTPGMAIAAVKVLEHNGFRVLMPGAPVEEGKSATGEATCCGMPNLDGGDVDAFVRKVQKNVDALYPQVKAGLKIVVPGPTCGYTMKREWPEYLPTAETRAVAEATMDLMEFLVDLGKKKKLVLEFKKELGAVAYHMACHLRAQKIGAPGQRVLSKVPGTDVTLVEECSAVDGTWGMKAAHYQTGRRYAQKLARGVIDVEPSLVVSDCTLAGLRLDFEAKGAGQAVKVVHPVEALALAYGIYEPEGVKGITPEEGGG